MRSRLYRGTVTHHRLRPTSHRFRYRVFYLYVDLDELDDLDRRLRLFSRNRFNLFSIFDRDHGPDDGTPVRTWIDERLAEAGIDLTGGSVTLLAYPRVLGYVFNPLAVWYCFGSDGELAAVVYEVRNTFGDKHSYLVRISELGLRHDIDKQLHVSPFMDMDQTYRFAIQVPGDRLTLGITQTDTEGVIFRAGLSGSRMELTDAALLRLFLTHPLVTAKSMAAIHWQGVRLWLKAVGFRRRPEPPAQAVSMVETRADA